MDRAGAERILRIVEKCGGRTLSGEKRENFLSFVEEMSVNFDPSGVPDWVLEAIFTDQIAAAKARLN